MNISILHWNVWVFEKKENILELLKTLNPDIVCLQELTIGSTFQDGANIAEYLASELGYHQFHKAIPNLVPSEGVGDLANGILSRFPIVSTDWRWIQEPSDGAHGYDDEHRLYVEITTKVNNIDLSIGTAHVSYTHKFMDTPKRKIEADNLIKLTQRKDNAYVVTGDLNSTPDSYLVNNLRKHLKHVGPDFDVKTWTTKPFSYNGFEETELNWRLDYVFTTKDVNVLSSEVIQTEYSDHLPILTKLSVS